MIVANHDKQLVLVRMYADGATTTLPIVGWDVIESQGGVDYSAWPITIESIAHEEVRAVFNERTTQWWILNDESGEGLESCHAAMRDRVLG